MIENIKLIVGTFSLYCVTLLTIVKHRLHVWWWCIGSLVTDNHTFASFGWMC